MKTFILVLILGIVASTNLNGQSRAPAPSAGITFGNGARLIHQSGGVTIVDGGRSFFVSQKNAHPLPISMRRYNCGAIKHWLDTHKVDDEERTQTIKVKNEATNDIYEVVLTGPQEGVIGQATTAGANVASR